MCRILGLLSITMISGCQFCATGSDGLSLHGRVVDADTRTPLGGLVMGGTSFTNGEQTDRIPPFFLGRSSISPSDENGDFKMFFSVLGPVCSILGPLGPIPVGTPPMLPTPDQVEVIVVRGQCENRFLIDINEDTVVDMSFPDDVIELRNPILVPRCEASAGE